MSLNINIYNLHISKCLFSTDNFSLGTWVVCSTVLGLLLWPLIEYTIHRWLFHLQPPDNSPLLITLHFGIHGLHHKVSYWIYTYLLRIRISRFVKIHMIKKIACFYQLKLCYQSWFSLPYPLKITIILLFV